MNHVYQHGSRNGFLRILVLAVIFLLPLGVVIWKLVCEILEILKPITLLR